MGEKEDKSKEEIERRIDESKRKEKKEDDYRDKFSDITKMQAPDKWPDPPEVKKESDEEK